MKKNPGTKSKKSSKKKSKQRRTRKRVPSPKRKSASKQKTVSKTASATKQSRRTASIEKTPADTDVESMKAGLNGMKILIQMQCQLIETLEQTVEQLNQDAVPESTPTGPDC